MAQFSPVTAVDAVSISEVYSQIEAFFAKQDRPSNVTDPPGYTNLATSIREPSREIPEGCELHVDEVREAVSNLFLEESERDYMYNHWSRISHYPSGERRAIDQWRNCKAALTNPEAPLGNTILVITHPDLDFGSEKMSVPAPYFSIAQFMVVDDSRLSLTGIYRRQEMSQWWVVNIWELMAYRDKMIDELEREEHTSLLPGPISTFAVSAWWSPGKLLIVDRSEFDDPGMTCEIADYLSSMFEDRSAAAARELARLTREKSGNIKSHNAPLRGLNILESTLDIMRLRFSRLDPTLYDTLSTATSELRRLTGLVTSTSVTPGIVDQLKRVYLQLSQILDDFAEANSARP